MVRADALVVVGPGRFLAEEERAVAAQALEVHAASDPLRDMFHVDVGSEERADKAAPLGELGRVGNPFYLQLLELLHAALASASLQMVVFTDGDDELTAIFCSNDVIALGAINAARELGVSIPGQLSLIGFGDISMAGWEVFALTTVGQNMDRLAARAIEQLCLRIQTPARPVSRITVDTELVRRGTHGPPQG